MMVFSNYEIFLVNLISSNRSVIVLNIFWFCAVYTTRIQSCSTLSTAAEESFSALYTTNTIQSSSNNSCTVL